MHALFNRTILSRLQRILPLAIFKHHCFSLLCPRTLRLKRSLPRQGQLMKDVKCCQSHNAFSRANSPTFPVFESLVSATTLLACFKTAVLFDHEVHKYNCYKSYLQAFIKIHGKPFVAIRSREPFFIACLQNKSDRIP